MITVFLDGTDQGRSQTFRNEGVARRGSGGLTGTQNGGSSLTPVVPVQSVIWGLKGGPRLLTEGA